jgi:hypothetical protein
MSTKGRPIVVKTDFLAIRDNVLNEVHRELEELLQKNFIEPNKTLVVIRNKSKQFPTVAVKAVKRKILGFPIYETYATVEFTPDVASKCLLNFPIIPNRTYTSTPDDQWRIIFERTPGHIFAACYNQLLEMTILNAVAAVSQKLKLSEPVLQRVSYDSI